MPNVQVVGDALKAADALKALASRNPDVVIVPAALEGQSSLRLVRTLHERRPEAGIVILGSRFDPQELAEYPSPRSITPAPPGCPCCSSWSGHE